jgi:hypothetical protein
MYLPQLLPNMHLHWAQECLRASHEVLKPQLAALGAGYQEFLGAVQLLHSRCFFLQTQQEGYGCHVAGNVQVHRYLHLHFLYRHAFAVMNDDTSIPLAIVPDLCSARC